MRLTLHSGGWVRHVTRWRLAARQLQVCIHWTHLQSGAWLMQLAAMWNSLRRLQPAAIMEAMLIGQQEHQLELSSKWLAGLRRHPRCRLAAP